MRVAANRDHDHINDEAQATTAQSAADHDGPTLAPAAGIRVRPAPGDDAPTMAQIVSPERAYANAPTLAPGRGQRAPSPDEAYAFAPTIAPGAHLSVEPDPSEVVLDQQHLQASLAHTNEAHIDAALSAQLSQQTSADPISQSALAEVHSPIHNSTPVIRPRHPRGNPPKDTVQVTVPPKTGQNTLRNNAAIVEDAIGAHRRNVLVITLALIGLAAGIAAALFV